MIKVLMCGNHPSNKGGMTSVIKQIIDYNWNKEGIDIKFISTFIPGNLIIKSIFFLISYTRIFFIFLLNKPDIVHMHMSYKGSFTRKYLLHRLCKIFGVKDIIHLHGSEFEKWYGLSTRKQQEKIRRLLKECNYFVVLGIKWKDVILKIEPQTNVQVVSNGIKIPKDKVCWNDNLCRILFLGVLIPRKGISDLLDAISIIKEELEIRKLKLVIAGTGESEKFLKDKVNSLDINKYVDFLGWTEGRDKENIIKTSQIMVSPSYNEGLPISILEAISYGMPVISTNVGDISSVVINDVNGFLIMPGDVSALANAIIKITSRKVFENMSIESKKIAYTKSIDIFYENLLWIYNEGEKGNE